MNKQDYEELQLKFNNSGMTLKAFLQQEGVAYSTYNYWGKKTRMESAAIFVWFNVESVFWYFLIKLGISMFLGFLITPVYLIYCLYKIVRLIIKR